MSEKATKEADNLEPSGRSVTPQVERSGIVTGARIILLITSRPMSPSEIADRLAINDSYVRKICRELAKAGVLICEVVPQRGTPPLHVYSLIDEK